MADSLQLEASTDRVLLEDGTGVLLLEVQPAAPTFPNAEPARRLNRMRLSS